MCVSGWWVGGWMSACVCGWWMGGWMGGCVCVCTAVNCEELLL